VFELAIYGGTFAPVHNGHVHAAKAFFEAVRPDKLMIIPTLIPPHKQLDFTDDPSARLHMLKLAFMDERVFENKLVISDFELNSPPPSYTVNTLRALAKDDQRITFLMGTDMFLTLHKWREPDEICKLCRIAFMRRETEQGGILAQINQQYVNLRNNYNADIITISAPPIEISSSDIRCATDEMRQKYLPKAVYDYIKENGLYDDN
jgi:nicotinate-nucleotide adenylyltransferase